MTENNLCNEVLENAIGVHRSLEKIEPLEIMDAVAVQAMEELLEYRAIGTIEEFKALKEKSVVKKPKEKLVKVEIYNCGGFNKTETRKICPVCKAELVHETFCYNCGQKIDWQ